MIDTHCGYCVKGEPLAKFGIYICDLSVSMLILFKEQSHPGRCIVAYKDHISEMTLTGIKAAMTLYPGVALGIAAIILYFFYGLTDDKFKQIAEDLNNGKWEHGTIE